MKTEEIKSVLKEQGIEAEEISIMKNGVICTGFRICTDSNVSPVVYYSQKDSLESFMEKIHAAMSGSTPEIDLAYIMNREYIRSNISLAVQKRSQENLVKKEYLNLDVYLRLRIDLDNTEETGTIKVNQQFLELAGISEEEIWEIAVNNNSGAYKVRSMAEAIGLPVDLDECPFYVVTNENMTDGAAALFFPEIFKSYCIENGLNGCLILPSSTQEVLILNIAEGSMNLEDLAGMVNEINTNEVDPVLQLDPVVYRYDLAGNCISIACSYVE